MATFAEAITSARSLLNDTEATYAYSDTDLLGYANDAIADAAILRPDLFTTVATHTCTADSLQTLVAESRIMEVFCVVGGGTVTEVPRESLDRFLSTWMSQTPAAGSPPVNWCRHPRSDRNFFLFPPPVNGLSLRVQYSLTPARATSTGTTIPLPLRFFPALVNYMVSRAEMRDDEHAQDGRATAMMELFLARISGDLSSRQVTDREDAGVSGSTKVTHNG